MALTGNGSRTGRLRPSRDSQRPRRPERPFLDQAIAINGELRVKLLGLNVLPIQVKLLISSKDVAAELGLDWWRTQRNGKRRRDVGKHKQP